MKKTFCDVCGNEAREVSVAKCNYLGKNYRLSVKQEVWTPLGNAVFGDSKGEYFDCDICDACTVDLLRASWEVHPKMRAIRTIKDVSVGQCVRGHQFMLDEAEVENLKKWFAMDLMSAVRTK